MALAEHIISARRVQWIPRYGTSMHRISTRASEASIVVHGFFSSLARGPVGIDFRTFLRIANLRINVSTKTNLQNITKST